MSQLSNAAKADAPRPAAAATTTDKTEKTPPPNQVALAWQTVARDIKFSDPALYDSLQKKVMQRLETKSMVDPATEINELGKTIADLKAQKAREEKFIKALESERDTLLGALAMAVPELSDGKDRVAVALARIDWLKAAKAKAATAAAKPAAKSARDTGEQKATPAPEPEDAGPAPSDTVLMAVAAGSRKFSDAHREWCVGEAMVLSGFEYTPVELIQQGDAAIAEIIVKARKLTA
jgi:ribosomal 50S subunit-associated protein YjgA (DUF615 family)